MLSSLLILLTTVTLSPGKLVDPVACAQDETQTYALYLPSGYDPAQRYPALLIFDPRARGAFAAEIFRPAAEELGWILLSSNNTMSDGPVEPNLRALKAMWPDLHRYAIDPARIYAAGFSGGGMLALMLASSADILAGVIDVGGRWPQGLTLGQASFAHYGASGRYDFNFLEMSEVDEQFARRKWPHRLDRFDGRHQWFSPAMARTALLWMEVIAMQQSKRKADRQLVDALYISDLQHGAALETEDLASALRHFEMMDRSYGGLRDLAQVRAATTRLRSDSRLGRDQKREEEAARYEESMLRSMEQGLARITGEAMLPPAAVRGALRIDELLRMARSDHGNAPAARRVLESIITQLGFYQHRRLQQAGETARAAALQQMAQELRKQLGPQTRPQ